MSKKSVKVTDEEIMSTINESEKKAEKKDKKAQWIERMTKSAKTYYKICPYFDKKSNKCFLNLGGKCDRDGKFEGCPTFISYLDKKYEELTAKKRILPMDFMDVGNS